jgi:adenosylcobinamide-GDP ribazoletransferase
VRAAFSYFSVLPVGAAGAPGTRALAFLPLVRLALGALAGGAAWCISLSAPHAIAAVVAFTLSIVLTGALHVDGFLDSCDALFAGVTPERRLEIMKDPRHGTFAVAGFACLAALWIAALWTIPAERYPLVLAFCGGTARWAMTLNAFFSPYARAANSAKGVGERPSPLVWLGWWIALSWAGALLLPAAIAQVAAAGAAALLLGGWARAKLGGGLTGDVYGFGISAIDVFLLLWQAAISVPRS